MTISIKVDGLEELNQAFDRLGSSGKREAARATRASLEKVRGDAVKAIQRGPTTGMTYERGPGQNLSSSHRASAPGEAPATDTGTLASSINVKQIGPLVGTVGSSLNYAGWLEFGTLSMDARPWLAPSLESNNRFIVDKFKDGLRRATAEFER